MTIPPRHERALGLIEKTILGMIAGASAAIGVVEVVFLVGRIASLATAPSNTVSGIQLLDVAAPAYSSGTELVTAATFDTLSLSIVGLPPAARGFLIAAEVSSSALVIGICAVLAWLCLRVFVGRPFVRSATWGIGIVAVLVVAGGFGSSILRGIAHAEIALFLDLTDGALPILSLPLDPAPLGWSAALAVVAGAFELGQRMQRDTETLV